MAIIKPRRIQVRVQSCECLIRGGLVSFFLRCPEKSKGNSLKCDTAQLRTAVFFPYLINKNTPAAVCMRFTAAMMITRLLFRRCSFSLTAADLFCGRLTEETGERDECVGLRICVTHFHCFIPSVGIRFDNAELNINVITGGFCCCQDFFSPSAEGRV